MEGAHMFVTNIPAYYHLVRVRVDCDNDSFLLESMLQQSTFSQLKSYE